jgi:alcohol dehydrogenase (nicotinoprotein)
MCVVGSFSEYSVLSEWSCVKIEDWCPMEIAALVSCGVTTGFCSAIYAGDVRVGETAVIFGTGGVGMNAVQGARYAGAKYVIAIGTPPADHRSRGVSGTVRPRPTNAMAE